MSISELLAQGTSFLEVGLMCISVYLTVVSGYLLVAYKAGKSLSKTQLNTISFLFIFFSAILSLATFASLSSAIGMFGEAQQSTSKSPVFIALGYSAYVVPTIQFVGILLSVKFMIDVRNN